MLQFKPEEINGIIKEFEEPGTLASTGLFLGSGGWLVHRRAPRRGGEGWLGRRRARRDDCGGWLVRRRAPRRDGGGWLGRCRARRRDGTRRSPGCDGAAALVVGFAEQSVDRKSVV